MAASPLLCASAEALKAIGNALDELDGGPKDLLDDQGLLLDMIRAQGTFREVVDLLAHA